MKKVIILLIVTSFSFAGCYKVETPTEQPFFVHLYKQFCPGCPVEPVVGATVHHYLFKDKGKEVDEERSYESVYKNGIIYYTDGSHDTYQYQAFPFYSEGGDGLSYDYGNMPMPSGSSEGGVYSYKFSEIPNGNYILFVVFSYSNYYVEGAAYKNITVNYDYQFTIEKKTFLYKKQKNSDAYEYGCQKWSETWL